MALSFLVIFAKAGGVMISWTMITLLLFPLALEMSEALMWP